MLPGTTSIYLNIGNPKRDMSFLNFHSFMCEEGKGLQANSEGKLNVHTLI
jgi:hypothetical protein